MPLQLMGREWGRGARLYREGEEKGWHLMGTNGGPPNLEGFTLPPSRELGHDPQPRGAEGSLRRGDKAIKQNQGG